MKIENKRKALVTSFLISIFAVSLFAFSGTLPASAVEPPTTISWYQKPPALDYAQSGVPDFDQKQDNWNSTTVVSYTLFASTGGWGFTPQTIQFPGPLLTAVQGDTVTLTLASADGLTHNFHLDYDNDGVVDPGEPVSPNFGAAPIVYPFTLTKSGKFTYRCPQLPPPPHPELGPFNVNPTRWTWCGPVAVADSLWWWDSHIDGGTNPPPAIEDHFPLVQNYTPGIDDHAPANVMPFVQQLAALMKTDQGKSGTNVNDMQAGINAYLVQKGLNMSFNEVTSPVPTFENIRREFVKCEDVVLLLGFYEYQRDPAHTGDYIWVRVGGHYVTVAGVGNNTAATNEYWIMLSDPFLDSAEDNGYGPPYVPTPHPAHSGNSAVHNNATLVSHDPYKIIASPQGIPIPFGIEGYNVSKIVSESGLYENGPGIPGVQNGSYQGGSVYTGVEYAVVFSPTQYEKPAYPEYAPSGVPDFDQKQDSWWNPITMKWSYCGPVALANSLWWFDSKFDNGTEPDGFPLVQNYGPWDDHSPLNVPPLISELAWLADTDGKRTGIIHNGTYVSDLENATRWYFKLKGLNDTFYERTWHCNFTFANVEYEVEKCEDVVLLLGFYELQSEGWVRLGGHYVTVIGVNASGEIKFSDPCLDNAEGVGRGEVLPPGHVHNPLGNTTLHNDALYVSHDWYTVNSTSPIDGTHWGIEGYPASDVFYDVNGANESNYYQGGPLLTAVEYAVVISPLLHGPTANFTESKHTAYVNEVINFDASGSLPGFNGATDVPIANYTWNFGDGNTTTVTIPTITHKYTTNGLYTVTLTVTTQDDPILIANGLTQDSVSAIKTINPLPGVHDVAVTGVDVYVNPSKAAYSSRVIRATQCYPTWLVPYKVNVTVKNEGNYTESFNVTVFLQNSTGNYTKGTKAVNSLAAGASKNVTFTFAVPPLKGYNGPGSGPNSAAWPYPTYTVWANASVVSGETNTTNNAKAGLTIKVVWPGDISSVGNAGPDGKINTYDLFYFAKSWNRNANGPTYYPPTLGGYDYRADFNMDGIVDTSDLYHLGRNWGKGPLGG